MLWSSFLQRQSLRGFLQHSCSKQLSRKLSLRGTTVLEKNKVMFNWEVSKNLQKSYVFEILIAEKYLENGDLETSLRGNTLYLIELWLVIIEFRTIKFLPFFFFFFFFIELRFLNKPRVYSKSGYFLNYNVWF